MASERIYIYCIVPWTDKMSFDQEGIEAGTRVRAVPYGGIAAVVSETSSTVCDPTRRNMAAHNRVLEALLQDHTVLPARFGLVSNDEGQIRELLARYRAALVDCISRLRGKTEVGVKVFWQREKALSLLKARARDIESLEAAVRTAPPACSQALLVEVGRKVKSQAEEWQAQYGHEMYSRLVKVAADGRRHDPVDISNIMNASFLVDLSRAEEFDAAVNELDEKHGDWTNIKYVGPMPAYNFVSLEMYLQ